MSGEQIDSYLAGLDGPARETLTELRDTLVKVLPDAEQCISYGLPAFRLDGKVVAGFAAFKNHLSYLPHSGSVLTQLADATAGHTLTKGSLHFARGEPLPEDLVRRLVAARIDEAR